MASRPKIVILPGLDGTGLLLTDFVNILQASYPVEVITYPTDQPLSYDALLDYVKERLPGEAFILIGESFSGPLAIRVASENPPFLEAIVLGASFARLDLPFRQAFAGLIDRVPARAIPFALLDALLTNGRATPDQRGLLKRILRDVSPDVLSTRAKEALLVDLVSAEFAVRQPLLYLRASADRLIPSGAADLVASIAGNISIRDIPAPHFLFQTEPALCAKAVTDFANSLSRSSRHPHRLRPET